MPLIAMNDYMDGIENLKVSNSGIPGAYLLGLNGLGADDGAAALGPFAFNASSLAPFSPGNPGIQVNPSKATFTPAPQSYANQPSSGSTSQSTITSVFDNISKLVSQIAPAIGGHGHKPKVVIQKDPDYTTYAVIGGAVIVASVLAIAVGKSGRRKRA